jgi:hypothetical protein
VTTTGTAADTSTDTTTVIDTAIGSKAAIATAT